VKATWRSAGRSAVVLELQGSMTDYSLHKTLISIVSDIFETGVGRLVVDILRVGEISHPGIAGLKFVREVWSGNGGKSCLAGPHPGLYLPALAQIQFNFPCYPTVEEALIALYEITGESLRAA